MDWGKNCEDSVVSPHLQVVAIRVSDQTCTAASAWLHPHVIQIQIRASNMIPNTNRYADTLKCWCSLGLPIYKHIAETRRSMLTAVSSKF